MKRTLAAAVVLVVAACASRGPGSGAQAGAARDAGVHAAGATPAPGAASPADAAPSEPDARPVAPADVLEGAAAEAAVAEAALAADAGTEAAAPVGLRADGVGPFRLGQARAEVARLAAPSPLVRLPGPAGAPRAEEARLFGAAGPWLRVRVYAGRVVELEILARDGRALTDEQIGVGSTFDEAQAAHGDARAVRDEQSGKLRGYVLADLPGVLWIPAPGAVAAAARAPDAGDDAPTDGAPPPGAVVWRVLVLGPEALAPPD